MNYQARTWITAILTSSVLIVLAALLGALSEQRSADPQSHRPSTFFTDESGSRALFLIMKQLFPSVEQWRRPLDQLPAADQPASPSTLVVAGPMRPITQAEAMHLDQWLSDGGQLILAVNNGWPIGPRAVRERKDAGGETEPPADAIVNKPGQEVTYLSTHKSGIQWSKPGKEHSERITGASVPGGELIVKWRQNFSAVGGAKIVASAGAADLAIEIPVGKGRIVALADPTIISNGALRGADNAVWLVTLAAGWGNGRVVIDEFHHGFGQKRGALALTWAFAKTPWAWCLLQVGLAGLLYLFGYRRRFGRISEPALAARASPQELVAARGGFFQAAAAQKLAVELIVQNLCHDLSKAHGKIVDLPSLSQKFAAENDNLAKLFVSLGQLSNRTVAGERLTDEEFVEVGRTAGKITQGPIP